MVSLLLAVIYLAFVSLGLPDSLLGSGWPAMYEGLNVSFAWAGIVSAIIAGGTILSSLFSARLVKKFSTKYVVVFSVLATAVALLGFSFSGRFWQICLWAIPYGLGAGAIDAALNNYVALHYSARHMSWLHCFWGVGTIVSPYVMSIALTHAAWQTGYRVVSYVQFGIVAVLFCALPLWRAHQTEKKKAEEKLQSISIRRALDIPGVPAVLLGFFCYSAVEATCMLWSASFLVGTREITEERAAAFASLFFIGITVGRFLSGFVADKLGDANMIRIGSGIIALGVLLLTIRALPVWTALAALVLVGLGCAPIYPAIIHATPQKVGARHSQTVIGLQIAGAYTGTLLAPPLFGAIASGAGLSALPIFLAVALGGMFLCLELSNGSQNKKTD